MGTTMEVTRNAALWIATENRGALLTRANEIVFLNAPKRSLEPIRAAIESFAQEKATTAKTTASAAPRLETKDNIFIRAKSGA